MAYRNDENAIEARRAEIERELRDVRSRADQFEYLKWRAKELEQELAAVEQTKESLKKARLPMLSAARIASPCSANWYEMKGDDRVRFCGSCQKNVFNLSAMTTAEAEALIREKEGDLCARMYLRDDDTVITADCPVGVRRKWMSRVAGAAVTLAGAAAAVLGYRLQPPLPRVAAEAPSPPKPQTAPVENPGMLFAAEPPPLATLEPPPPPRVYPKTWTPPRHTMGAMIPTNARKH